MANAKTTVETIWNNDSEAVTLQPTPSGAEAGAEGATIVIQIGQLDNEKRSPRFRAFVGQFELVKSASSVPGLAKAIVKAVGGKDGFGADSFDVDGFVADVKAAFDLDAKPAKESEPEWTALPNADYLAEVRVHADEEAARLEGSEGNLRSALYALSKDVAEVAAALTPRQFTAWAETAPAALKRQLATGKNAKAEFCLVGRLPEDFFEMQPERTVSPKAFQRNYTIALNKIAERAAGFAWRGVKKAPNAGRVWKFTQEALHDLITADQENSLEARSSAALARALYDFLEAETDGFNVVPLADSDDGVTPAKDAAGDYVVPMQFGSTKSAHELLTATCKAVKALAPEEVAEREGAKAASDAAAAVNPRRFANYGVTEAAMHLATILSSHESVREVFSTLSGIVDQAEQTSWEQALTDARDKVDAEAADAAAEEEAEEAA